MPNIDRKFNIQARSESSGEIYTEANCIVFLARDAALPATLAFYQG